MRLIIVTSLLQLALILNYSTSGSHSFKTQIDVSNTFKTSSEFQTYHRLRASNATSSSVEPLSEFDLFYIVYNVFETQTISNTSITNELIRPSSVTMMDTKNYLECNQKEQSYVSKHINLQCLLDLITIIAVLFVGSKLCGSVKNWYFVFLTMLFIANRTNAGQYECGTNQWCMDMYPSWISPTSYQVSFSKNAGGVATNFYILFTVKGMACLDPRITFIYEEIDYDETDEYLEVYDNDNTVLAECGVYPVACNTFSTCFNNRTLSIDRIETNDTYQIRVYQPGTVGSRCNGLSTNAIITIFCAKHITAPPTTPPTTAPTPAPTGKSQTDLYSIQYIKNNNASCTNLVENVGLSYDGSLSECRDWCDNTIVIDCKLFNYFSNFKAMNDSRCYIFDDLCDIKIGDSTHESIIGYFDFEVKCFDFPLDWTDIVGDNCNYYKYRDKRKNIGTINCRICTVSFQTIIHHLSEPVDVYSDWIDECQKVNEAQSEAVNANDVDNDSENENVDQQSENRHYNDDEDEEDANYQRNNHNNSNNRNFLDEIESSGDEQQLSNNHNRNDSHNDSHNDNDHDANEEDNGPRRLLQRNVDVDEDEDEEEDYFEENNNAEIANNYAQNNVVQNQADEEDSDDAHDYTSQAQTYAQQQVGDDYSQNQAHYTMSQEY